MQTDKTKNIKKESKVSSHIETKEINREDRILSEEQKVNAHEMLKKFLEHEQQRSTKERFKVLDFVLNYGGHFNADELYADILSRKQQNVSRATVYSSLELFEKAGIVVKHHFGGSRSYYEVNFDEPNHDHLICIDCGHISEFVQPELVKIRKEIAEKAGLRVKDHSFQIFAECLNPKECENKS
jgi:Fur family ferric uptake transcriptional regulator